MKLPKIADAYDLDRGRYVGPPTPRGKHKRGPNRQRAIAAEVLRCRERIEADRHRTAAKKEEAMTTKRLRPARLLIQFARGESILNLARAHGVRCDQIEQAIREAWLRQERRR